MDTYDIEIGPTEAAKILEISRETVRAYARDGRLKGRQTLSGHWKFRVTDVTELREQGLPTS